MSETTIRKHNYSIDESGTITVKNFSSHFLPKQKIYEQIGNTLYEIETDYEGIHSLPSVWNKYLLEEDKG